MARVGLLLRPRPQYARALLLTLMLAISWAPACDDARHDDDVAHDTGALPDGLLPDDALADSALPDTQVGDVDGLDLSDTSASPTEGCNPLGTATECLLPFPSDVFLVDDADTATGKRVALGAAALSMGGERVDFTDAHPADGFSLASSPMALFAGGVAVAGLIPHGNPQASLERSGTTLLLRALDGAPVLHFAELDMQASAPAAQAVLIRPMVPLQPATRYIVAIRGLTQPDGTPVAPPEQFRRLRDGGEPGSPALAALAARYETDVFGPLGQAGVARDGLLLAWDFTTRSEEALTADARAIVADTSARLAAAPPALVVTDVQEDVSPFVARRIELEMTVPLYLTSEELGAGLRRDAGGQVEAAGSVQVPLLVWVPRSVVDDPTRRPAPVVHMGHGFFGSRAEFDVDWAVQLADEQGFVMVAVDWWGLSDADKTWVVQALVTQPNQMFRIVDRIHQAMANNVALTHAVQGPLGAELALQLDGVPLFDPDQLTFYGISAGAILGTMFFALSPDYARAAFSVGGGNFAFIMSRSVSFAPLNAIVGYRMGGGSLAQQKFMALSQLTLDRVDPIVYGPHVVADRWDGAVDRRVLWQVGMGDPAVPVLSAHMFARAAGLSLLQPSPRALPGLAETSAPASGSVLVEFDFGLPTPLPGDLAEVPADNEVHEGVRRVPAGQQQVGAFLFGGEIAHFCDGPCDPD